MGRRGWRWEGEGGGVKERGRGKVGRRGGGRADKLCYVADTQYSIMCSFGNI